MNPTPGPFTIRRATLTDTPALITLGAEMHSESPRYSKVPYDPERLSAFLSAVLPSPDWLALMAEHNGEPVGMMVGFVVNHCFSSARYAADLVLYVSPEFRGSSMAVRMLREFETWAATRGAAEIVMGVTTEVHTERTVGLYARCGYRDSGVSMVKDVL